jgi:ribonuclease D
MSDMPLALIDTRKEFLSFIDEIQDEKILAVDLEADSFHCYTAQVCLLQITTSQRTVLIDPLKLSDLSPLKEVFENPDVRKIFHAADYDVRCLHRDFGIEIRNIFDTMTGCKLLGEKHLGLADLLREHFGVELDKRFQCANWSIRPLPEDMLHYAAEDTRYLHRLAAIIEKRLEEKGRLAWALEEFSLLEMVRHNNTADQLVHSIREAANFNSRQLAALEKLLNWRDREARMHNRRYFQIIGTRELAAAAACLPQTTEALAKSAGFSTRLIKRHGDEILKIIAVVRQLPMEELPKRPTVERRSRNIISNRLIKELKAWRKETAAKLHLNPGTLINNSLLEDITRRKPATLKALGTVPGIKDWQVEAVGGQIIDLITPHLAQL